MLSGARIVLDGGVVLPGGVVYEVGVELGQSGTRPSWLLEEEGPQSVSPPRVVELA